MSSLLQPAGPHAFLCTRLTSRRIRASDAMNRLLHPAGPHAVCTRSISRRNKAQAAASVSDKVLAAAAALALGIGVGLTALPALAAPRSIPPCSPGSSCVSTSSFASPANYLPPWSYFPASEETSFQQLQQQLQRDGATIEEVDEEAGYLAAALPYTTFKLLPLPGIQEVDDLQFLFSRGAGAGEPGVLLFRSVSRASLLPRPSPPFCFTPGCISGPGNRARMEALRDRLGWSAAETDEDKKWVQILLH